MLVRVLRAYKGAKRGDRLTIRYGTPDRPPTSCDINMSVDNVGKKFLMTGTTRLTGEDAGDISLDGCDILRSWDSLERAEKAEWQRFKRNSDDYCQEPEDPCSVLNACPQDAGCQAVNGIAECIFDEPFIHPEPEPPIVEDTGLVTTCATDGCGENTDLVCVDDQCVKLVAEELEPFIIELPEPIPFTCAKYGCGEDTGLVCVDDECVEPTDDPVLIVLPEPIPFTCAKYGCGEDTGLVCIDDQCVKPPAEVECGFVCQIYCPNGNVMDANGCPTCACNP
ncbi:hypothetical protein SARC_09541 [Sphaeroforma arctica JP610]|uniref:Antistasin-like domain-containing protein n=1 Tax=Sphaeroforma arctica JP610 TaxID=667725 RepID=A0A0L0FPV5_9EUKA|nr:hypothetical protein SARC_09541 [Sphaeroforma arctica JP610]KNC78008.1 hypothetical protein SARC_09541 [Sphaeroforma arctica JP610]|eukprot:XP_014151910.1 hypothetical protein SARC_09541 [Sphaeroforma arctica JP610]